MAVLTKVEDGDIDETIAPELMQINKVQMYGDLNKFLYSKAKIEIMPDANL